VVRNSFPDQILNRQELRTFSESRYLKVSPPLRFSFYRLGGKRIFDILGASGLLLLLSPVACLCCLAIGLKLGRPVTFCQRRLGKHGKPFLMHKFRTMSDAVDSQGNPLPDEARLGRFGRLLRSTSLDELPQLFDILRGDMSLVGPRPLLVRYRDRYTDREWKRHLVRPGLTGWCQVNGRNALDWDAKLELDVVYAEGYDFWWDLRILVMTVGKVVRRSGISAQGEATMPELRPEGLLEYLKQKAEASERSR
jgi:lipopolysaccharide/colanic/teichoic acid biosynthesis glycosyltransferase